MNLTRPWLFLGAFTLACALATFACKEDDARPRLVGGGDTPSRATGGGSNASSDAGGDAAAGSLVVAPSTVTSFALTAGDVYFTYIGTDAEAGTPLGVLARVSKQGGAPQVVVTGGESPRALTFDGTKLSWIDDGAGSSSLVVLDGTNVRAVASGLARGAGFAVAPNGFVVANPSIGAINVDLVTTQGDAGVAQSLGVLSANVGLVRVLIESTTIYLLVAESPGASVYRMPLAGGVPENVWSAQAGVPRDLAVTSGRVFVALENGTDGQIVNVPVPSGAPQPLVAALDRPSHLALDGTDLFYATAAGELARAPISGGSTATLAVGLGAPSALSVATDGAYVAVGNEVRRIAR